MAFGEIWMRPKEVVSSPMVFLMVGCSSRSEHRIGFYFIREWLKSWANEVHHVRRIVRIALFVELPAVITKSKQPNSTAERIGATRKTTRLASQAGQVMA